MDTSSLDQFNDILGDNYDSISPDFSPLSAPSYMPPDVNQDFTFSNPTPSSTPSLGSMVPNIMQAGGSILSGIGGYMQGQEEAGADEYNANLALEEGQFQVNQISEQEEQTLSTQKAMYAKAGVEQSGSVLNTALSTATQYEYSKQVTAFNAQSEANMDNYEAAMAKSQGKFALAEGLISGAGDIAKLI